MNKSKMKVLWIVNKLTGALHKKIMGKDATGGLWLEAMLDRAKNDQDMEIVVVNVEPIKEIRKLEEANITYYTIPGVPNEKYDYNSKTALAYWKQIIESEKPDLIQLWGTEMPYGLALERLNLSIPIVVYVQGVLESIGRYYTSGLSTKDLRSSITLRDIFQGNSIRKTQKKFIRRSEDEKQIIRNAGRIIIENEWAEAYYRNVYPNVKIYKCPLSVSEVFERYQWNLSKFKRHTIMCPAADYPVKGLHILLKALSIVKNKYPDVKLHIPGSKLREHSSIKNKLKQTGYEKIIHGLIKSLNLRDNVEYVGRLTADEMARMMSESNCFVMSSSIENHSSTLKEALTVGVPSVASSVGGVPEYAENGVNCLLYRFEEYEMLAFQIVKLFEWDSLCESLSTAARKTMKGLRENNDFYEISKKIYWDIIIATKSF